MPGHCLACGHRTAAMLCGFCRLEHRLGHALVLLVEGPRAVTATAEFTAPMRRALDATDAVAEAESALHRPGTGSIRHYRMPAERCRGPWA